MLHECHHVLSRLIILHTYHHLLTRNSFSVLFIIQNIAKTPGIVIHISRYNKTRKKRITGRSELEGPHKDHQDQLLSEWPVPVISYQLSC